MKKQHHDWISVILITIFGFSVLGLSPIHGNDTLALRSVHQMLGSLNHIRTLSCDVEIVHQSEKKTSVIAYRLSVDQLGQKAAVFKKPVKQAYIQNKKGIYLTQYGEAKRLPNGKEFPFEVPSHFLRGLKLKDVTDNYSFLVQSKSDNQIVVDMVPIGTGGASISDAMTPNSVSMIRFYIQLPTHALRKLEIFKGNAPVPGDIIEIAYDQIPSPISKKPELVITRTRSIRKTPTVSNPIAAETKTTWYRNLSINAPIPTETFDEEAY